MEHPIIFLGYSISDINIQNILESIMKCLTPEKASMLKNRFILGISDIAKYITQLAMIKFFTTGGV